MMLRVAFWSILWLLGLGLFRIYVRYEDGLEISIKPWTDLFRRKRAVVICRGSKPGDLQKAIDSLPPVGGEVVLTQTIEFGHRGGIEIPPGCKLLITGSRGK